MAAACAFVISSSLSDGTSSTAISCVIAGSGPQAIHTSGPHKRPWATTDMASAVRTTPCTPRCKNRQTKCLRQKSVNDVSSRPRRIAGSRFFRGCDLFAQFCRHRRRPSAGTRHVNRVYTDGLLLNPCSTCIALLLSLVWTQRSTPTLAQGLKCRRRCRGSMAANVAPYRSPRSG